MSKSNIDSDAQKQTNGGNAGEESNGNKKYSGNIEKIFTTFSIVLIFSLCAFFTVESFGIRPPAAFSLEVSYPVKRGDFTAVEVYVKNSGGRSAKSVLVTGEVTGTDGKPVEAEAMLDWLPANSKRKVTLILPGDAVSSSPEVQIRGFEDP